MGFYWRPYVPVAQRRAQALRKIEKLRKKGVDIQPIEIEGRKIASSFWGKAWCDHLESFSDYENRLPRGRTYVRNGSVCHLDVKRGRIEAIVSGSELYEVAIEINPLKPTLWKSIKGLCSGRIGSLLELLRGRLSDQVMGIVTHRQNGLMPQPGEIKLRCSCPDWADMCKHVAAVMYGVGSRLDHQPELLFTLRGVDAAELISTDLRVPASATAAGRTIADDKLADVFGIELEKAEATVKTPKKTKARCSKSKTKTNITPAAVRRTSRRQGLSVALPKPSKKEKPKTTALDLENPTSTTLSLLQAKLGLTTAELAERLGVTPQTIYSWQKKRGKLNLRYRTQNALIRLQQEMLSP